MDYKNNLLLEQWKMAVELHKHEDNLIWQKFNYFVAIHGILVSAMLILVSSTGTEVEPIVGKGIIAITASLFGFISSVAWFLIQYRGKLYQNLRVEQAKKVEKELKVDGEQVLTLYNEWPKSPKWSKSAQGVALWLIGLFGLLWLIFLIYSFTI